MGNTKSLNANDDSSSMEPNLAEKLSQAISDTSLNKKSSTTSVADARKKKYSDSNRSMSTTESKNKQMLSSNQRQILKYCINNSKDDLGERIFRRVGDKNVTFQNYFESLPRNERAELTFDLKQFVVKVVEMAVECENIENLCRGFGEKYAHLDFKPDFVQIANSMTTECVYLDAATHPTTDTLSAWSQLTTLMFSLVRDGYYSEMRRLRRISNSTIGSTKESDEQTNQEDALNDEEQHSSRSAEALPTSNDSTCLNQVKPEAVQFLSPPSAH